MLFSNLRRAVFIGAATLAGLFFAATGQATPYQSASGLTSPSNTLSFSELGLAAGTSVTNQYAAFGVDFVGLFQSSGYSFTNESGSTLTDFSGNCPCGPTFEIDFTTAVSDAVFSFVTNSGTSTIASFLGSTAVESASLSTSTNGYYAGFTGSLFNRILITPGGGNSAAVIDNLQFNTAVPEPASLTLLGAGLFGLVWLRHRQGLTKARSGSRA
jgi:hypothetical protein